MIYLAITCEIRWISMNFYGICKIIVKFANIFAEIQSLVSGKEIIQLKLESYLWEFVKRKDTINIYFLWICESVVIQIRSFIIVIKKLMKDISGDMCNVQHWTSVFDSVWKWGRKYFEVSPSRFWYGIQINAGF